MRFLTAIGLLLLTLSAPAAPNPNPQIGGNLEGIIDWSRSHALVDVVKQARSFGPYDRAYAEPWVPVDENGWPTTDFGVYLMTDIRTTKGLAGTYKLSFTGRAKVTASVQTIAIENLKHDEATNQTTADVVFPEGAPEFVLKFKDTENGVKNLKLIRPGYTDKDVFTKPFLNHLQRFSILRVKDWLMTDSQTISEWGERSHMQDARWSSKKGVPWEVIIQLANLTKKNLWVDIPFLASDDYVTHAAQLLKETLDPKLAIYVEYSNEIWNTAEAFKQSQQSFEAVKKEIEETKNSNLTRDKQKGVYTLSTRRTARRLKEIAEGFARVFGPTCITQGKIRPILAGQFSNLAPLKDSLEWFKKTYHDPKKYFYGISGGLYISSKAVDDKDPAATPDAILAGLSADLEKSKSQLLKAADLSKEFRLPFVGYEGGTDTFGNANIAAKKAANNDPRMKALITTYLTYWFKAGLGELVWFTAGASNWDGQYGSWGLTDDMTRQDTPKIQAIDEYMQANAPKARR